MEEKIVVSGGTGLVGSHLLYDLATAGKKVLALKRAESNVENAEKVFFNYSDKARNLLKNIEWVDASLADVYSIMDAMKGVSYVYHCAAMVSFDKKHQAEMIETNIAGTTNMVNAALQKGIKKFCHVSSIATIGKTKGNEQSTEEMFWKSTPDNSNYSISKYGAEREVWRAAEEGLDVVIVNPALIIGAGNWQQSSSNMFGKAYKGIKFYTDGMTGFIDVRDVSALMIKLMESEIKNERFILSSENQLFKYFFDLVHTSFNKPLPSIEAGKAMSGFAWRADSIRQLLTGAPALITRETALSAHSKRRFSNEKIRKVFPDYKFIPLEQSVKDTCKLFLKDKESGK